MAQISITFYYIILNTFGCHIKKKLRLLKLRDPMPQLTLRLLSAKPA